METSRSRRRSGPDVEIQYENVFFRIITGTVCNIVFGVIVTITGIVVTSTTFHDFSSASRIYLAGPILIAAGCLCLTRAVINKAKERNLRQSSLRRRRRRRRTDSEYRNGVSNIYSGPAAAESDQPPPYEAVATPGSMLPDVLTFTPPVAPPYQEVGEVGSGTHVQDEEPRAPPPSYEEAVMMQTRI